MIAITVAPRGDSDRSWVYRRPIAASSARPPTPRRLAKPAVDGAGDRIVHDPDGERRRPDAVERALGDRQVDPLDPVRRRCELLGSEPDECLCLGHAREPMHRPR